ncbi:hypothetical protein VCR20J5_220013 [Vibrio crassostreae]|nr:hypothetical protein VCR20J5_220013 [Vibrio crassostreae]CDT47435.1 hypothetical protein VCR15J5_620060 [Vibrio crassostreae]
MINRDKKTLPERALELAKSKGLEKGIRLIKVSLRVRTITKEKNKKPMLSNNMGFIIGLTC